MGFLLSFPLGWLGFGPRAQHMGFWRRQWRRLITFTVIISILALGYSPGAIATVPGVGDPLANGITTIQNKVDPPAPLNPPPGGFSNWNPTQMSDATVIVEEGRALRLGHRALVIGVAVALQECGLYNCSASTYPETQKYPGAHTPSYQDHDSVGMFQQRPQSGWCHPAPINCMDPHYAAHAFFAKLRKQNWESGDFATVANNVQGSCCPGAYAKHEGEATAIVSHICGTVC